MAERINLGDEVRDMITGFTGIVVCASQWLHGCLRLTVQAEKLKDDGTPVELQTFDEPQLELVETGAFAPTLLRVAQPTGGPIPAPTRPATPPRR